MKDLFGKLPGRIRYNKDISDFAKIMYAEIYTYNLIGECRIKNKEVASMFGKTVVTISRAISELHNIGAIVISGERDLREIRVVDYPSFRQFAVTDQEKAKVRYTLPDTLKKFFEDLT